MEIVRVKTVFHEELYQTDGSYPSRFLCDNGKSYI